jgi:hypothetical protein
MKVGDKVRLVRVPLGVKDDGEFETRAMLTKCLGRIFTVKGFQSDNGRLPKRLRPGCWVELDMGEAIRGSFDTIWVEPNCLERLSKLKQSK